MWSDSTYELNISDVLSRRSYPCICVCTVECRSSRLLSLEVIKRCADAHRRGFSVLFSFSQYLPIYSPSEEEKKNPALYAHNVRRLMAKALQVPVTDYSFEDCQLATAQAQIRLPVDTALLEFAKLLRALGLKRVNSEKLLQDYGKRARELQDQRLSLEDFARFLELPASDELRDTFALFDEVNQAFLTNSYPIHTDACDISVSSLSEQNEDHSMDVREFVIAFSVVCRPAKTLDTIRLAFQMFEAEEDGAITENELLCILRTALGLGELKVSRLFRAIDEEDSGKITFESFREFVDQHPDFAEQYLYSDNAGFGSSSPSHAANGFCAGFSPREQKKLD
uniref:EF-hand domain-containing protein n=1 Tax=Sinocyclocheilus rhinocerous TaxID=307959 RepID=A0A673IQ18_9TELE